MAAEKITYESLFDPKLQKEIDSLKLKVNEVYDSFKKMALLQAQMSPVSKETTENTKNIKKAQEELSKQEKKALAEKQKLIDAQKKLTVEYQKNIEQQKKHKQELIDEAKYGKTANDSLRAKEQQLKRLREEYRRAGSEAGKSLLPEIKKLDKEVKGLNAEIGQHQMNVGNYASALGGLNPVFGGVINSVLGLKTAFLTLMATPIGIFLAGIAATIGIVVGAFKVMASTDSGATRFSAEFEALKQKFDEIRKDIIDFNFAKALSRILWTSDSEKAAFEFIYAMDRINDRYAENKANVEESNRKIQENIYLSKNQNLSGKDRLEYLKKAQEESKKLLEIEKKYATDIYNAKLERLVIETKVEKTVLDLYATGSEADRERLMKYRDNLKKYRDSNEEDLFNLVELAAKKIQVDTNYFSENKRLHSQYTAALKEMYQEEIAEIENNYALKISIMKVNGEKEKKIFEVEQSGKLEVLKNQYKRELISETEFNIKKNEIIVENRKFRFEQRKKEAEEMQFFINLREQQELEAYKNQQDAIKRAYQSIDEETKLWEENKKLNKQRLEELNKMSNEDWGLFEEDEYNFGTEKNYEYVTKTPLILRRLGLTNDDLDALKDAYSQVRSIMEDHFQKEVEISKKRVENADREVENARENLQTQIALKNEGLAYNMTAAQKELDEARRVQKKALEQEQRALQQQRAMQTIEQASNLVTASAQLIRKIGADKPYVYLPLLGLMWGTFVATKTRAAAETKEIYEEGGTGEIGGGTHASGNDTFFGTSKTGKKRYAQRGERWAIFNDKANSFYGNDLKKWIKQINSRDFDFNKSIVLNYQFNSHNLENGVNKIIKNTETKIYQINGKTVEKRGLNTIHYV